MTSLLSVSDLTIETRAGAKIVDGVSFELGAGDAYGLVGESGSGKTTTGLAVLGWIRPGLTLVRGSVFLDGAPMLGPSERDIRARRGRVVAYVPQNAGAALNPSFRVQRQITEVLRQRSGELESTAVARLLELVNLPSDQGFQRRFPHQLSGGQLQRLGIAVALACEPKLLVLDEPTTGLDVITQKRVLDELDQIRAELKVAMISISHDLALIATHTDSLGVMLRGKLVEYGASRRVLVRPTHAYTRALVDASPDPRIVRPSAPVARADRPGVEKSRSPDMSSSPPLLDIDQLFAVHSTRHGTVVAADDVSFSVARGGCVALVGESGSGKTTIARCVAGLHEPASGAIRLDGEPLPPLARNRSLDVRRSIQIVFQDPFDSLNPRRTARDSIMRPLRSLAGLNRKAADVAVADLLEQVHLPARLAHAYPAELSGGECQRVAIARALAARPDLLVCDEITSALDASVQARVLELIEELRARLGLGLLFISHDLGVVAAIADRVVVLERGVVCEQGDAVDVLTHPEQPYTRLLMAAAPSLSAALADPVHENHPSSASAV